MGLSNEDKIPFGININDAYQAIIEYLQSNYKSIQIYYEEAKKEYNSQNQSDLIYLNEKTPYHESLKKLVDYLIETPLTKDIEKQVVLFEVICGHLENFYHKDNGKYKMAAYAQSVLKRRKNFWLSSEEKQELSILNVVLNDLISKHNKYIPTTESY